MDGIQRRRDRVRRSQAAYRQRQADALHQLKEDSQQMQVAIEKISSLIRGDERPELRESISEAALAAGLQLPCPPPSTSVPAHEETERSLSESSCLSSRDTFSIDQTWFDHYLYTQLSQPPEDIIPYLGQGARTFGACLFWSVMDHFQSDCDHQHSAEVTAKNGLSHSQATRDIKISLIRSMLNARLEYKRTGFITAANATGGEQDLGMILHRRVLQEYKETGLQSEAWLTSLDVERLARALFGTAFGGLERAAQGEGEPNLVQSVANLVCKLCDSSICFGDGPRWHVTFILHELSKLRSQSP